MKKITLSTLVASAVISSAFAQETQSFEPLTVVTASGVEQKIKNVTENMTIITAHELEQSHLTNLGDALAQFANIPFTQNGAFGQSTSLFLRGFDSKRTLVLIDGIRINDVSGLSGAQFQYISLNDIAQIEIIKGAQSGIWGADASAGVINIITKKGKKGSHAYLSQSFGSFNTHESSAVLSHKEERYDLKLSASSFATDGISAAESKKGDASYGTRGYEGNFTKDPYINTTYNLDSGINITQNDRVSFLVKSIHSNVQYDSGAGKDGKNSTNLNNSFYSIKADHKDKINQVNFSYNYSTFMRDYGIGKDYTGDVHEVKASEKLSYLDESFLVVGGDYQRHTHNKSYGNDLNKTYTIKSGFATNVNRLNDTIISENIRYDLFSTLDASVTGKMGVKQYVNEYFISMNYGSGYNVPTLYQLSVNSALKPEQTVGGDVTIGNENIEFTYFYNEVTNLIEYYAGSYKNGSETSVLKGIEAKANYSFKKIAKINANYSYLSPRNAKGERLARRPQQTATVNLTNFWLENISTLTQVQYVGLRYDKVNEQGANTGDYALVNLTANYKAKTYSIFAQVNNLFNTFYQVVDGYGTMGINFKVGMSANF